MSFKDDLMELENEADMLRASAKEQRSVIKAKDKLSKDNQELRALVASQDEQVITCSIYIIYHWVVTIINSLYM